MLKRGLCQKAGVVRWAEVLRARLHPSWAFYAGVIGVIIGTVVSVVARPFWTFWAGGWWLMAAGLVLVFAVVRTNYLTVGLAVVAGMVVASCRIAPEVADRELWAARVGETVTVVGRVAVEPSVSDGKVAVQLADLRVEANVGWAESLKGTLYVQIMAAELPRASVASPDAEAGVDLLRSDELRLCGKLGEGFGTFAGSLFRPEVLGLERAEPGDFAIKFKGFFAGLVRERIPAPAVDLGLGYLVGDKSGLPEEFAEALRMVGMTHVVVASGAHLGILVELVKKLCGRVSRFASLLGSLLVMMAFMLVVGFTASMTRAGLVAGLSLVFGYVGRKFTPMRLILLTAALTLMISPDNLQNLGWQLSFASFFGLLILAPRLTRFLYGGKRPPWLAEMLITSLAASLACTPLLIFNFGSFSLLAFVANLVILPTLPYAMLLVFLTGVTSFWPWLAGLVAKLATMLLELHMIFINFLSGQTALIFEVPAGDAGIFLLYIPVLAGLCLPKLWKMCYNRWHGKSRKSEKRR